MASGVGGNPGAEGRTAVEREYKPQPQAAGWPIREAGRLQHQTREEQDSAVRPNHCPHRDGAGTLLSFLLGMGQGQLLAPLPFFVHSTASVDMEIFVLGLVFQRVG